MPYYCDPCERWFNTANSYNQHVDYSPAHNQPDFECSYCDRHFSTENSLHQHCSSAAGHPYCRPCKRMFMNMNNLVQVCLSISHLISQSNNFPAPAFQNPHGQQYAMSILQNRLHHRLSRNHPPRIGHLFLRSQSHQNQQYGPTHGPQQCHHQAHADDAWLRPCRDDCNREGLEWIILRMLPLSPGLLLPASFESACAESCS
jgi:hypothetical protein